MSTANVTVRPALALAAILLLAAAAVAADAPEATPTPTLDLGLTMTQSGYSSSWVGDERGSLTWVFNGRLALQDTLGRAAWTNNLSLAYGQSHIQTEEGDRLVWQPPRKTSDRIFDELVVATTSRSRWEPYAGVTFESQFQDAADHFLSPAVLTEAVGVLRTLVATDRTQLTSRLGPGARHRFVTGMTTITDAGVEWVTDLSRSFDQNLNLVTKLRLFQAVASTQENHPTPPGLDPDAWKGTDVAWDATLTAAISKYVQTTLFFELLYDKQVSDRFRFRDVLGLGLSYKLM